VGFTYLHYGLSRASRVDIVKVTRLFYGRVAG